MVIFIKGRSNLCVKEEGEGTKIDFGCPRGNDVATVSGLDLIGDPSPVVCKGFDSYPSNNNYCQYYKE